MALVGGVGYARSRAKYVGFEKGLACLDYRWELEGALCAASRGVVGWPPVSDRKRKKFNVTLNRIHGSFALSFLVLALGVFWPIEKHVSKAELEIAGGPKAWESMEEWLNVMDASDLFEESSLDAFEESLDTLESQPREDWFSDGSLEATDFLLSQSTESTLQFLESLEMAMQSASRFSEGGGAMLGDNDLRQLNKSIDSMDLGTLALKEDLMKALSDLSEAGENGVDQQTLQEMLDRMKDGAESVRKGMGIPRFEMSPMYSGESAEGGDGEDGPAPLTLSDDASAKIAGSLEGVSNDDRTRAILGDTAFTSEVRIDGFEPNSAGKLPGNRAHNVGDGGAAVWKTRARPDEQNLLKNYFSNE